MMGQERQLSRENGSLHSHTVTKLGRYLPGGPGPTAASLIGPHSLHTTTGTVPPQYCTQTTGSL